MYFVLVQWTFRINFVRDWDITIYKNRWDFRIVCFCKKNVDQEYFLLSYCLKTWVTRVTDVFAGLEHKSSLLQMDTKAVDPSDFDCILCCRTLWRPVTTPCGHSYCARCLERCLDYSSSCPLCMTSLINVSFIHFSVSAATTEWCLAVKSWIWCSDFSWQFQILARLAHYI